LRDVEKESKVRISAPLSTPHPPSLSAFEKNNCVVLITERNFNRCGEQHLEEWVYIFAQSACVCFMAGHVSNTDTHFLRTGQTVTQKKDGEADCSHQHWHHWPIAVWPALCLKNIFTALTQIIIINYSMMKGWQVQNSPRTVSLINHTDLQIRSRIVT